MASTEEAAEVENLLEFLYLCPVGLARFGVHGDIDLMNPMGAQLLLPLAEGASLANIFDLLASHVPELRNLVTLFAEARGTVCEGRRVAIDKGASPNAPTHLSLGVVKIDGSRFMAIVQDITRTVQHERLLRVDEQRFKAIYEGMRESMICTLDEKGLIETWNASGERLLGFVKKEVEGRPFAELSGDEMASSRMARSAEVGFSEIDGWFSCKDGSRLWGEGILSPLRDAPNAITGFSVVLLDMTERKRMAERLVELATKDGLTGLANRRHFFEQAEIEFARFQRYKQPLSLVMMDVDHFKAVNDTYGHSGGDEVLRALGALLQTCTRGMDLAARYGGEEFVVLLPSTPGQEGMTISERIRSAVLAAPVPVGSSTISYSISLGVAEAGAAHPDLKSLVAAADKALYAAKKSGRNRTVFANDQSG